MLQLVNTFDKCADVAYFNRRLCPPCEVAHGQRLARAGGAERGLAESHDRLDALLGTLASPTTGRQGP